MTDTDPGDRIVEQDETKDAYTLKADNRETDAPARSAVFRLRRRGRPVEVVVR